MAKTEQVETEETKSQAEETQSQQEQTATEVQSVEFTEAEETGVTAGEENLDILLDISMPLTVNLGKTIMPFRKLLQLGPGSVVQLDKPIGQPADLFIQDIKFATGDIVVVDDCFAVRIRDILGMEQTILSEQE